MEQSVSVVIPTLNEEDNIAEHLRYHGTNFDVDEFVVVDGGSHDRTVTIARDSDESVRVITTDRPGRGHQLRRGCEEAKGEWIMMLHVDSRLPEEFSVDQLPNSEARWGWFDVRVDGPGVLYGVLSRAISYRSALFRTPTGDQAIWIHRDRLESIGGIPDVPIMEDVVLVDRLKQIDRGDRIKQSVVTSARKWQREGILTVILLMWWFRLAFWLGASPTWIYRQYYGREPEKSSG